MKPYLKLDECENGYLYRISARNFGYGVFNAKYKGFIGIRVKFSDEYLDTEIHWDEGGTVHPYERLEKCPLEKIEESYHIEENGQKFWRNNEDLMDWIYEVTRKYFKDE